MHDTHPDFRNAGSKTGQAAPAHQEFHWIEGPAQKTPYADFLELTLDITSGTHTCQQLAYSCELERAANAEAEPGQMVSPALGIVDTERLKRLSIAATRLLRAEARRRIDELNAYSAMTS